MSSPVSPDSPEEPQGPEEGIALCLSGGGYRAMVFHLGALWRLNDAGWLPRLDRISSVSGGSITAGVLGMAWNRLLFDGNGVAANFEDTVTSEVRTVASKTIDFGSVLGGILLPGSVPDRVAANYRKLVFGDHTLQDLPEAGAGPRFVINATNLQSGVLWRFSRPYMADYKMGRVDNPRVTLAEAVAASSAFPPVLSPAVLQVAPESYTVESRNWELAGLQAAGRVYLTDGGVYDNLGLETAYKRYATLLVSDGGGRLKHANKVNRDWARHSLRVLQVIDAQVRSLRKRQLIAAYEGGERAGAYWGIHSDPAGYGLADALPVDLVRVRKLATTGTRLKKLRSRTFEGLVNWGYVITDTALRRFVDRTLTVPSALPYPKLEIG